MSELKPLIIGDLVAPKPIIQGGAGIGISLHNLAGAVAKTGSVGIISSAQIRFREPNFTINFVEANIRAIRREMKLARETAPQGVIGLNITVVTKHYDMWVKEAVKAGADIIISGAGPPVSPPEHVESACAEMEQSGRPIPERRIKLAPIVPSAKSAMVICRVWDKECHVAPDLVVVEGPLAGGHLGFSLDQLVGYGADIADVPATYDRDAYDKEVKVVIRVVREYEAKYNRHIPVVTAGDIYTREDVMYQFELGAEGVQVGTRFVTTGECDASNAYKQVYIQAKKEDIVITKSPVEMLGRVIMSPFLRRIKDGDRPAIKSCFQCLEHCDIRIIPYCITMAPIDAAEGDMEHALLFCGSNAYRAETTDTMENVMRGLVEGQTGEP